MFNIAVCKDREGYFAQWGLDENRRALDLLRSGTEVVFEVEAEYLNQAWKRARAEARRRGIKRVTGLDKFYYLRLIKSVRGA